MIRKRVPTDPPIEHARIIRVFSDRAEIEHPEVLAVPVLEELFRVLSTVAVEPFHARRGVAHDDHLVGDIREVCRKREDMDDA